MTNFEKLRVELSLLNTDDNNIKRILHALEADGYITEGRKDDIIESIFNDRFNDRFKNGKVESWVLNNYRIIDEKREES